MPESSLAESLIKGEEFSTYPEIIAQFRNHLNLGRLKKETSPCFYVYETFQDHQSYTGLWASTLISDLDNGIIRKHEKIHLDRSDKILDMIRGSGLDFNPILITYKSHNGIAEILSTIKKEKAFLNITLDNPSPSAERTFPYEAFLPSPDNITSFETFLPSPEITNSIGKPHRISLWKVREHRQIESLILYFKELKGVYLSDGHHRADAFQRWIKEKSSRLRSKESEAIESIHEIEEAFSSIYFSLDQVKIRPYHRWVNLHDPSMIPSVIDRIKKYFDFLPQMELVYPKKKGEFLLLTPIQGNLKNRNGSLIFDRINIDLLQLKEEFLNKSYSTSALPFIQLTESKIEGVMENLDVSILQEYIFKDCLQLSTKKPLGKLEYLGGKDAESTLIHKIIEGEADMGFILYPPSFEEIKVISDAEKYMPQKSTYFEPKIPSGLIIKEMR